jgi:hypothetical protein
MADADAKALAALCKHAAEANRGVSTLCCGLRRL